MSNRLTFFPVAILLPLFLSVEVSNAQQDRSSPAMPGAAIRERNRQMDEYDRELERLRNGPQISSERRRNLFPQINEDFQRLQIIHNEMVRMIKSENSLNYGRLVELTAEMKKRSNRLRTNLALPATADNEEPETDPLSINDTQLKASLVKLHDLVVSFVGSPIFKNLALLDANVVTRASSDLRDIIQVSEKIRKAAETLSKTAQK